MQKYICNTCGYIYDPEEGDEDSSIAAGTAFESIPDEWVCPTCGTTKSDFEPYQRNGFKTPSFYDGFILLV